MRQAEKVLSVAVGQEGRKLGLIVVDDEVGPVTAPAPLLNVASKGLSVALLALSRQSLCHGTTLQIDVPGTALCSAQAIHVQIK